MDQTPKDPAHGRPEDSAEPSISCNFCSKPRKDVRKLLHGADRSVYICDECVVACFDILADEARGDAPRGSDVPKQSSPPTEVTHSALVTDLVTHLRKTHFYLAILSLALCVVAFATLTPTEQASEQLELVRSIASTWEQVWSDVIELLSSQSLRQTGQSDSIARRGNDLYYFVFRGNQTRAYHFLTTFPGYSLFDLGNYELTVDSVLLTQIVSDSKADEVGLRVPVSATQSLTLPSSPQRLKDVVDIWDTLNRATLVFSRRDISEIILSDRLGPHLEISEREWSTTGVDGAIGKLGRVPVLRLDKSLIIRDLGWFVVAEDDRGRYLAATPLGNEAGAAQFAALPEVLRWTGWPVHPGTFADSFPDLYNLSLGKTNWSWDQLDQYFSELGREAPIKLFGAELPTRGLAFWGLIVLASTLAYNLSHLQRLHRLGLGQGLETSGVWTGVYTNNFARWLTWVGTVALPGVTCGFLVALVPRSLSE